MGTRPAMENARQPQVILAYPEMTLDRLDAMQAFVVAVDRGSLAAAGRALGRSAASITRAVASLEDRVGTELLRRTTRALKLTEAGERYAAVARRVLSELEEAEKSASAARASPVGLLTVTAPLAFGAWHVRAIVERYLAENQGVRVRLLLLDRVVNLVDEGVDVAVRIAHLPDSALVATAVGAVRRVVVASPRYVETRGRPKTPQDLAAHACVSFTGVTPTDVWTFSARRAGERAKQVKVHPVLSVNTADAAVGCAVGGLGVTCALSYQVADAVLAGELVELLVPFEPGPLPVHVVYPAASTVTPKVRAFVDLAAPALRAALTPGATAAARPGSAAGAGARRPLR
jgi:DNA-binding transcriptional LysR family regulator